MPARESNTFILEIENNQMKLYQAQNKILNDTQGSCKEKDFKDNLNDLFYHSSFFVLLFSAAEN